MDGREKIAVIGAGSWGTTLANLLAEKELDTRLYVYEADQYQLMWENRHQLKNIYPG